MSAEEFEKYIECLFNSIKRVNLSEEYRCIPILDDEGSTIGLLKPISYDYEKMYPDAVSLFSKWRRENPSLSNSIFEVTDERTKKWVDRLILKRKDRLLFFVDEVPSRHVGHIAYSSFDFKKKTAEIDAVLRGEKSIPGIMTFTIRAMIKWADENLNLSNLQLRVTADNDKAISLYKRCGFEEIGRISLFRRELDGETRWDEDESRNPEEAERFELLMRLRRIDNGD